MGSYTAPTYAFLFMGKLVKNFVRQCSLKPTTRLRFLDDIFMIWDHPQAELEAFISRLNIFIQQLNSHLQYLIQVCFSGCEHMKTVDSSLPTEIHIISTDVHTYLHCFSCHPRERKESIPYSVTYMLFICLSLIYCFLSS